MNLHTPPPINAPVLSLPLTNCIHVCIKISVRHVSHVCCVMQISQRCKSGAMLDLVDGSSLLYRLELEGIYEGLYDRAIE
jgi:hypothetical protein